MGRCTIEEEVRSLCSCCGRRLFRVIYEVSEGDGYVVTRSITGVCSACDWMSLWPRLSEFPQMLERVRSEARSDPKLYPAP